MGASVRPVATPDDAEFQAWKAKQGGSAPSTHDDAEFQQWKASQAPAAPRSTLYNAINTVDNALTAGLGQKFNAAWNAASDVVHGRDSFSRSFGKNLDAENEGLASFRENHPVAAVGANVAGTLGQIAAAAPLAAAGEIATGLGLGARTAAAAKMGGAIGAVGAVGNADPRRGIVRGAVLPAVEGGAAGAALGAVAVPATQALATGAQRLGSRVGPLIERAAPDALAAPAATTISPRAAAIASVPQEVAPDRATTMLIQRLQRAGLTPQDALDRLGQIPADKPVSVMEIAGDQSHPIRQLGKWVARTPSAGAAQLRSAIADRMTPLPNAQRVLGDVSEAMGQSRTNLIDNAATLKGQQLAGAKPHYDAAMTSGPVPFDLRANEEGPTLAELMKRPSIRNAVKFHNDIAAERGESPLSVPGMASDRAPVQPLSIRDGQGRLRPDLTNVPDSHLDAEWQRLAELNAKEEAMHSGVQDAGYRMDYEELPSQEKTGRSGRRFDEHGNRIKRQAEDLPDADGMVDAERLASDNKIVTDYNKSAVVRRARQQAMDRIQAEINRRPQPWEDDTSFSFGANAAPPPIPDHLKGQFTPEQWAEVAGKAGLGSSEPGPNGVPLKTLQQIKFKLDDALGFAKRNGQLPDGTPATKAKLGAINDTRRALLDIMTTHSPEYAAGNASWAGDAAVQEAGEQGHDFLSRPIDELQKAFPAMTSGEQAQHNVTAVSGPLRNRIFNTSAVDRAKIFNNPDIQERLQTVVPPDRFGTLTKKLGYEHQIAVTNQQITGGSDTAENLANDADASGKAVKSMLSGVAMGRPRRILTSAVRSVVNPMVDSWIHGVNESTANALAPKLTAGMKGRPEAEAFLNDLATQFDRIQRTRGSAPLAGVSAGSATGRLIGRDR